MRDGMFVAKGAPEERAQAAASIARSAPPRR